MSITFGGLASGMDTGAIIDALMEIERQPIKRLETEKSYITNRQKAFTDLDSKLKNLMAKAEAIDTSNELNAPAAEIGTEGYFTATASSTASLSSYQVEVVAMAQQQKDVSAGYLDSAAAELGTGTISLTVAGVANNITIDGTNNSLSGMASAINDADLGVTASIINDGTGTPYRLVLSGDTVADSFSLDASGLAGGTYAAPTMSNTQAAQQAHIRVDGIEIYSNTNSFDEAIEGVTLDILKKSPVDSVDPAALEKTTLSISSDHEATKGKIKEFADAYNGIVSFIADQADADWGNDASFRTIKRRLQGLLTTSPVGVSGSFSSLAQLGFETQRDGTLIVKDSALSDALESDFSGVIGLIAGEDGVDGISTVFADYLDSATDSVDGLVATRKISTESSLRRIDMRIVNLESRLETREKTLRAQFSAMEELVSSLSSQGSFLSQQMASMPTIGGSK